MAVRVDGRAVPPVRERLAEAFPEATDRMLVLVHGLVGHEGHWTRPVPGLGETYASRLQRRGGWTPVLVRTNTGLPVAENGAALADLLQAVMDEWPCGARRICLVGHSMGGLVVRSACSAAQARRHTWTDRVSDVVTLGTPHLGADLAVAAGHGARLTPLVPELAALGRVLEQRSPGIQDLERGLPDLLPLGHVRYRLVSAGLGSAGGAWDRLLGDLLVRRGSATGTTRTVRLFPGAELLHVPNSDHMALLNHPDVLAAMEDWLV
jgi:pimeloyl-ACP methyl ester carboxylesterase